MGPDFDSFDDLQCEDLYDENYIMENDYEDDYDDVITYDDLIDTSDIYFEEY